MTDLEWQTCLIILILCVGLPVVFVAIFFAWLKRARIAWFKRYKRKLKQKPVESNILVDTKMVPELMHRWNTWQEMWDVLRAAKQALEDDPQGWPDGTPGDGYFKALELIEQAIQKAEKK